MLAEILLSLFYACLFIWIIFRWRLFRCDGISKQSLSLLFVVKMAVGILLTLIYTYYYTVREEADIFKFFDDSKYIFNALFVNPLHYLQLVFGINADADYLQTYVAGTKYWAVQTDAYQEFTGTLNANFFNAHRLITRFNAVVRIFSFGHYTVHVVFMCFLSLMGLTAMFKSFYPFLKEKRKGLLVAVFLLPAVLFWSSGVLKEGFIFLTLGFFIYAFFDLMQKPRISSLLVWVITGIFLTMLKYYLLAALILPMLAYAVVKWKSIRYPGFTYLLIFIFSVILSFTFSKVRNRFPGPLQMLADKQSEQIKEGFGGTYCISNDSITKEIVFFYPDVKLNKTPVDTARRLFRPQAGITAYRYSNGQLTGDSVLLTDSLLNHTVFYEISSRPTAGSFISIPVLKPEIRSFLKALPQGLFNVFFRPHVFEINNVMSFPAAIENLLLMLAFIISLIFSSFSKLNKNLFYFLLFSLLSLYIVVGITTPVLGNIVRYKAPFLPFFAIVILLLADNEKVTKVFKRKTSLK